MSYLVPFNPWSAGKDQKMWSGDAPSPKVIGTSNSGIAFAKESASGYRMFLVGVSLWCDVNPSSGEISMGVGNPNSQPNTTMTLYQHLEDGSGTLPSRQERYKLGSTSWYPSALMARITWEAIIAGAGAFIPIPAIEMQYYNLVARRFVIHSSMDQGCSISPTFAIYD